MSNANRDYVIVYDVKNSSLVLSRPLRFYITDKNTSNIFVRLVTKVSTGHGIDQYTDIEEASSYVLTMRVIKPNNEVKSIEATQHELESIFQFDLTEDFKDMPGKYICELTTSTTVTSRQELITSDPFSYEVKRSILSNVGEIIETEDTTTEKLFNNLEASKLKLFNDLESAKTNLRNDLNATSSALNSQVQASDNKIENIKEELSSRLDATGAELSLQIKDVSLQVEGTNKHNRKLGFKFNVSPWWVGKDEQFINNDIELFKKMGVDGFIICVHVLSENSRLYVQEDLNLLLGAVNKIKNKGMYVSAVKMHCKQDAFNSATDSFDQYKVIVHDVVDKFKNKDIQYFTFLNEVPNIYNGEESKNDALIIDLSTYARNAGFKVGITCANDLEITETVHKFKNRVNYYDAFFRNTYPMISYKMQATTYKDSIYAWSQYDRCVEMCKELYPNKPFIMSECGIQNYWEALKQPSKVLTDGTNGDGEVAKLFYYGLFENRNLNNDVEEVWMWFGEGMHYDDFYEFVRSYTLKGWY